MKSFCADPQYTVIQLILCRVPDGLLLSGGVWNCCFQCVCVLLVSKIKIAIIAVAGSCFFGGKERGKMFVTCANLRGRIDRKCTVICCACVLSQITSGCHPIVSTIILCEIS